jgi:hypothetical protein
MQLKTVKTTRDLPFKGVELIKVDNQIREVVIGGKLRVKMGASYSNSLEVLVEEPFQTAQRHRVTATIEGFDPKVEHFENSFDADRAAERFKERGATVERDQVSALIDDAGAVVGETPPPVAEPVLDDLPF